MTRCIMGRASSPPCSEPESYPSPSQAESQASGLPFRQSSLRSDIRRDRDDKTSGKCDFFFNEFTYDYICVYKHCSLHIN